VAARRALFVAFVLIVHASCSRAPAPATIRLVDLFRDDMVSGRSSTPVVPTPRTEWRFDGPSKAFTAFDGVADLVVRDGLLRGRATTHLPILEVERTTDVDSRDQLDSIEIRLRASAGTNLAVQTSASETVDPKAIETYLGAFEWEIHSPLVAGDEVRTYKLRSPRPIAASAIRRLFVRPTDQKGAEFAIESLRIVFRKEHLAEIPSGIGFQGMSEIYRESIVSRSPEEIRVPVDLPERPRFELALGTVDDAPVTFRVSADGKPLLTETVSTPYVWVEKTLDLESMAGRPVTLSLSLLSDHENAIGVWGSPVVRGAVDDTDRGSSPRNVVLIWADTLRRDHLDAYGYRRETAPQVKRMASEGVLFQNNISQATWTKVSSPALLTSLYPSTNGVKDFYDFLPASATTLAEVYRAAGYATVSYSSNLFTGQLTNLHQGFEELHEDASLPEAAKGSSKTSRGFIDSFVSYLERHRDERFFAFLHLYDAHDPFEPRPPYDRLWADPARKEGHEQELAKVRKVIADPLGQMFGMPSEQELAQAGIDPQAFVAFDQDWYDGSIRGMDTEIGRVFERLRELDLDRDTLVVFAGDHGEEFLEHGHTFHGQSVYGELNRVPLIFRWPGGLEAGKSVDAVTETIDVMPTLLSLSGLTPPAGIQGESLEPLLRGSSAAPWRPRPAITEKARTRDGDGAPWPRDTESYSIVDGGFKLVHNLQRKEGTPEFELFDFEKDPYDQTDVASEHPDVVQRLSEALSGWYKMVNDAKLKPDASNTEGMTNEQLERLRSLGYIR
jgi:arylsulfatase A-like enzyme